MPGKHTITDMLGRAALLPVDAAQQILRTALTDLQPEQETVPLTEALDRILAVDLAAPENLPAHPRAVMDGYAVRAVDTFGASEGSPAYLTVRGEVRMGQLPTQAVTAGICQRIATGALLPPGADAVAILEHTVPVDETLIELLHGCGIGANLIDTGDDIRQGETALTAGQRLRPYDLGLLAGLGITTLAVYRRLRVGILATGDEIVPCHQQPQAGQIRNINNVALAGLLRRDGAMVNDYGIVADQRETFFPCLDQAVAECDVVLFSGGSSVGARDLGQEAIARLGPPGILVHGVALRPGKPVLIGLAGRVPVFGLPGHPVSALVCYDLFVKPALHQLSGWQIDHSLPEPGVTALLDRNINSAAGRRDVVRVRLYRQDGQLWAGPVLGKSGAITTLARAHGYLLIDEDCQGLLQGSIVQVYLYS